MIPSHRETPAWLWMVAVMLCPLYGIVTSIVFVFSGTFGSFGERPLRDVMLVVVSVISALALTYISMLLFRFSRRETHTVGRAEDFEWHLLVPCLNEESVVAETVSAARMSFPAAHVWVIDDASDDRTGSIVRGLQDFDDHVHLITRIAPHARTGKGDALNAAYRQVGQFVGADPSRRQRTVIGVLDADGYLSDNTLDVLAGPEAFGDQHTGGVQIEVWMKNRADKRPRPIHGWWQNLVGRILIRLQDIEFRTANSAMQLLRVQTGTVGMGGNGQFNRLTVLDQLADTDGEPWGRKLSEDFELGLKILALGYRTYYTRQAHVSQEALPYFQRLLTQRTRWAQGLLECASLLPRLRRAKVLNFAGFLEVHFLMSQAWLSMINLLVIPTLTILAVIEGGAWLWQSSSQLLSLLAAVIFLVLPYAMWGPLYRLRAGANVGWLQSAVLGILFLGYVYLTYLFYARAIGRMLTGRHAWAKTKRNADDLRQLETTPLPIIPTTAPLLDRAVVQELAVELEGHEDFARELISTFAIIWPKRLANVQLATAAEDPQATWDAVASIRVSAAMLGATRLAGTAQRMAELVEARDFEALRQALPTLEQLGADTVEEIRRDVVRAS
ncbi:glycosyltransferase [Enteractinococcus coprophilus]|uniref:Cellulose synthase/poly-beta-1,6-N-acetylglucosamine synthase-like glycosyltransferase n=2 Tax=Micrococcales TaxID=85006 RepID=A0A543AGU1_9MICC|nr:glycosyltransferase [Enteractinococcus coprophilus]TQL71792.1 cellulose synthase/poly-beta-1,6-N-acetylglucosamine synthase-like glycosyltransferase [Enteractinococcus coprophilus]